MFFETQCSSSCPCLDAVYALCTVLFQLCFARTVDVLMKWGIGALHVEDNSHNLQCSMTISVIKRLTFNICIFSCI